MAGSNILISYYSVNAPCMYTQGSRHTDDDQTTPDSTKMLAASLQAAATPQW